MSLRNRLLCLVALAMLGPAILVGLRFVQNRTAAIGDALTELANSAAIVAENLADRIQGTEQLQFGLARAVDLDTRDREVCSAFLSDVLKAHPQYTGILTIDLDGRLFCDSLRTGRNLDLRDRRYFIEARSATKGGVALQPVFGRLTNSAVLQIAHPARSASGELKFVLLASLNLSKFLEDHRRRLPDADLLLIAKDGTILVSTNGKQQMRAGQTLAGSELHRFVSAAGQARAAEIGAGANSHFWAVAEPSRVDSGVYVLAGISREQLVAEANHTLIQDLAVLAAVTAVLFALAWLLAEISIRRQLGRIADMAERLGSGDLGARIAPPFPKGELGQLMVVLNGAAESLQHDRKAIAELDYKLYQSQKMEAVGQLTGGVAHDFNNILTIILANADALQETENLAPEVAGRLDEIAKAVERAADLTRSLLAFSRKQPLSPKPTVINDLVKGVGKLLARTLGEHIELDIDLADGLWSVDVDRALLESALINLSVNARDAMPEGGKLLVETRNVVLGEADLGGNSDVAPGEYVLLAVRDTGSGMPSHVMSRIFDPFFTTKGVGKGTGLGLSMVYGFIKQSQGHIVVESEVGRGTSFRLYLPRGKDRKMKQALEHKAQLRGGRERILVVEDEPQLRANVVRQLESLGYAVTQSPDGAAALAACEATAQPFDLLLTDVVMPGPLDGKALVDQVLGRWPATKVVFMSGYSDNALTRDGVVAPGVVLLGKPFRKTELAAIVRRALDGNGATA